VFSPSRRDLSLLALISGTGAALLWTKVLVAAWPTLFLAGTICGQASHCPLCLPAAALTGIALAAATAAVWNRRRFERWG